MATYPVTPKDNSRRIRVLIRRVFLEVWDPIGVADEPMAQDEYDAYLGGAFELLMSGASDMALIEYLEGILQHMGMDASRRSLKDVVAALRKIDLADPAASFAKDGVDRGSQS